MTAPSRTSNTTDPEALEKGKRYARHLVAESFVDSAVADNTGQYPRFKKSELTFGKILGKGNFGTVYEIRAFQVGGKLEDASSRSQTASRGMVRGISTRMPFMVENLEEDEEVALGDYEGRQFISDHCIRNNKDARYAVKMLSEEVVADMERFLQGITDMSFETRFLSDISHPNIVKLRALACCDTFDKEYFLVMDRLYDTLESRIYGKWAKRLKLVSSTVGKLLTDRKGKKLDALYEERIVYAYDLAAAINYLHSRNIIYRDLKPENVGFDVRDDIKIFDFGLAKELKESLRCKQNGDLYNLTADTGSPRYMAPEVAMEKTYNAKCDVYSFAIVFWEMLALKRPYELYTIKTLTQRVYGKECKRPFVQECWNTSMKLLLKKTWAHDVQDRYSMKQVEEILRKESVRVRGGDEDGLGHYRRRSTFVFRRGGSDPTPGVKQSVLTKMNVGLNKTLLATSKEDDEEYDDSSMNHSEVHRKTDSSLMGSSMSAAIERLGQSAPAVLTEVEQVPVDEKSPMDKSMSNTSVTVPFDVDEDMETIEC